MGNHTPAGMGRAWSRMLHALAREDKTLACCKTLWARLTRTHARTHARTPARTRSHTHAHTHAPSCRAIKACPWRHAGGGMKHLRCACVQVTKVVSRGARAFAILDGDKYLPLSDFKECPRPQGLYLRVGQWLKVVSQCPTTPPSAPDPQPSTLDPKRRRHRQHAGDACDMRVRCLHVRCI